MKVVQFTVPVARDHSIHIQEDRLPHFYEHLHRHTETQITYIIKGSGTLIAGNIMHLFRQWWESKQSFKVSGNVDDPKIHRRQFAGAAGFSQEHSLIIRIYFQDHSAQPGLPAGHVYRNATNNVQTERLEISVQRKNRTAFIRL